MFLPMLKSKGPLESTSALLRPLFTRDGMVHAFQLILVDRKSSALKMILGSTVDHQLARSDASLAVSPTGNDGHGIVIIAPTRTRLVNLRRSLRQWDLHGEHRYHNRPALSLLRRRLRRRRRSHGITSTGEARDTCPLVRPSQWELHGEREADARVLPGRTASNAG